MLSAPGKSLTVEDKNVKKKKMKDTRKKNLFYDCHSQGLPCTSSKASDAIEIKSTIFILIHEVIGFEFMDPPKFLRHCKEIRGGGGGKEKLLYFYVISQGVQVNKGKERKKRKEIRTVRACVSPIKIIY